MIAVAAAVGVVFTPVFMGFMGGLPRSLARSIAVVGRSILEWHRRPSEMEEEGRAVNA